MPRINSSLHMPYCLFNKFTGIVSYNKTRPEKSLVMTECGFIPFDKITPQQILCNFEHLKFDDINKMNIDLGEGKSMTFTKEYNLAIKEIFNDKNNYACITYYPDGHISEVRNINGNKFATLSLYDELLNMSETIKNGNEYLIKKNLDGSISTSEISKKNKIYSTYTVVRDRQGKLIQLSERSSDGHHVVVQ